MKKPFKHDPQWAKAKRVCRLNMEDIRMAKELGLSPRTLMKNVPSPSQKWKLPVKLWIAELHEKRFGRQRRSSFAPRPGKSSPGATALPEPTPSESGLLDRTDSARMLAVSNDENVPF